MPHNLGHYLGLYVHDVGECRFEPAIACFEDEEAFKRSGLDDPEELIAVSDDLLSGKLRKGMTVTNEPGVYFIPSLLQKYKNDDSVSHLINWDKVEEYTEVGGVRIEDDLVITEDGHEVYHDLPRTCDEIEAWMAGKDYK